LITTNLDGIVRILRDIDIFIVHHLLGEASTGLYKIAREIARIPTQVTGPFYQAIYPELSKLTHSKNWKLFIKIMKQSSLTLGGILTIGCICFFIIGEWFTGFVFGSEYIPAFYTTLFCILSVVVWGFAQPLAPAMMALGKVNINLYIHLVTSIFYIFMLWIFTSMFQVAGAGFSLFIFYGIWSISMLISFKIQLNRISVK
jgi:O-antigen/teichoic acid export membrane protein